MKKTTLVVVAAFAVVGLSGCDYGPPADLSVPATSQEGQPFSFDEYVKVVTGQTSSAPQQPTTWQDLLLPPQLQGDLPVVVLGPAGDAAAPGVPADAPLIGTAGN